MKNTEKEAKNFTNLHRLLKDQEDGLIDNLIINFTNGSVIVSFSISIYKI